MGQEHSARPGGLFGEKDKDKDKHKHKHKSIVSSQEDYLVRNLKLKIYEFLLKKIGSPKNCNMHVFFAKCRESLVRTFRKTSHF